MATPSSTKAPTKSGICHCLITRVRQAYPSRDPTSAPVAPSAAPARRFLSVGNRKRSAAHSTRNQSKEQRARLEPAGEQWSFVADKFAKRQFAGGVLGARGIEQREWRVAEREPAATGCPTDGGGSSHGAESSYESDTESPERRSAVCHKSQVSAVRCQVSVKAQHGHNEQYPCDRSLHHGISSLTRQHVRRKRNLLTSDT